MTKIIAVACVIAVTGLLSCVAPTNHQGWGQESEIDRRLRQARAERDFAEATGRVGSNMTSKEEILLGIQRKPVEAKSLNADVRLLEALKAEEEKRKANVR